MKRRPILADLPMSRLALWSGRLGWFALTQALLSIIIVRSGFLEVEPAFAAFATALAIAVVAILLAFASFIGIWRQGYAGLGRAFVAIVLGLILLAYPGYLGYRAAKLPMINDITTDTENPPKFDVLARLRPRGTNDYPGAQVAALQQKAYPDIGPLELNVRPQVAYNLALKLVTKRKWHIVDAEPPTPGREGVIEAVARTLIMGFRDDIVVRVSLSGTGSKIDLRSASRIGRSDLGANASRIRAFLEEIDEAADALPEPRAEPPVGRRTPERRQPAKR
jgi:uncharacterized protein (DUF1499 family)